jgi:hypothetical protein
MAPKAFLPALAQERVALAPLATLLILNDLQSATQRVGGLLADLTGSVHEDLDGHLQRVGSAVVFSGHPVAAREIERKLQDVGLTTSLNLLALKQAISR